MAAVAPSPYPLIGRELAPPQSLQPNAVPPVPWSAGGNLSAEPVERPTLPTGTPRWAPQQPPQSQLVSQHSAPWMHSEPATQCQSELLPIPHAFLGREAAVACRDPQSARFPNSNARTTKSRSSSARDTSPSFRLKGLCPTDRPRRFKWGSAKRLPEIWQAKARDSK